MRKQSLHPRTAVINQKQKNKSKQSRLDALNWLQMTFPEAFDNRYKIQPLQLGIMEDIMRYADRAAAAGISKSKLREAVVLFTRRLDYLASLKTSAMRIDLLGNTVDVVSASDADAASLKIKKRVEKSLKNTRRLSTNHNPELQKRSKISSPLANYLSGANDGERPPLYADRTTQATPRTHPVVVTRKQARHYDPAAVARLKEKLGISSKADTDKA